jgi:hypothetical protein
MEKLRKQNPYIHGDNYPFGNPVVHSPLSASMAQDMKMDNGPLLRKGGLQEYHSFQVAA